MIEMITKVMEREAGLLLVLLACVLLRVVGLNPGGLSYDELQSVTHATLPVLASGEVRVFGEPVPAPRIVASLRKYDPHPPLHYLQLQLWMLVSESDWWARANSAFLSVLAGLSLYLLGSKIYTRRVGLLALLLFSLSPTAVYYGQEVRMYVLMMLLAPWVFYLNWVLVVRGGGRAHWVLLVASMLAFVYSHGASFLILLAVWSFGFLGFALGMAKRESLRPWVVSQVAVMVCASPWFYLARSISVGHTLAPDVHTVFRDIGILLIGRGADFWALKGVALLVCIWVIGSGLRRGRLHAVSVVCFLLVPLVACFAVSHLVRPVWLVRTLSFLVPFVCLFLAAGIDSFGRGPEEERAGGRSTKSVLRIGVPTLLIVALLSIGLGLQAMKLDRSSSFRAASEWLLKHSLTGESILVPDWRDYWCFGWYFLGPGVVDPLERRSNDAPGGQRVHPGRKDGGLPPSVDWVLARGQGRLKRELPYDESELVLVRSFGKLRIWRLRRVRDDEE